MVDYIINYARLLVVLFRLRQSLLSYNLFSNNMACNTCISLIRVKYHYCHLCWRYKIDLKKRRRCVLEKKPNICYKQRA